MVRRQRFFVAFSDSQSADFVLDTLHALVQPAGKTAAAEMVPSDDSEGEEANYARSRVHRVVAQIENVQFLGVERSEDHL